MRSGLIRGSRRRPKLSRSRRRTTPPSRAPCATSSSRWSKLVNCCASGQILSPTTIRVARRPAMCPDRAAQGRTRASLNGLIPRHIRWDCDRYHNVGTHVAFESKWSHNSPVGEPPDNRGSAPAGGQEHAREARRAAAEGENDLSPAAPERAQLPEAERGQARQGLREPRLRHGRGDHEPPLAAVRRPLDQPRPLRGRSRDHQDHPRRDGDGSTRPCRSRAPGRPSPWPSRTRRTSSRWTTSSS